MPSREGYFQFYFNKDQLKKLIEIFGTNNKEELKRKIEAKIFDEKPKENVDLEYKKLRNEKLKLDVEIRKRQLAYWKTFDSEPSKQASNAIVAGVKVSQPDTSRPLPPKQETTYKAPEENFDKNPVHLKEKYLQCIECGACFNFIDNVHSISKAKEDYCNHKFEKHNNLKLLPEELDGLRSLQ